MSAPTVRSLHGGKGERTSGAEIAHPATYPSPGIASAGTGTGMFVRRHLVPDPHRMLTLHVTNGDLAAQGLARSGLPGDVLAWRDVLHDGPVLPDDDREPFRSARAAFLADRRWADEHAVLRDLVARDARLHELTAGDSLILWFEPDLYDQLQLIEVLSLLHRRPAGERPSVSIVPADLMLGELAPTKFPPLYEVRRAITAGDLQRGHDAWRAFSAATPDDLLQLVDAFDRSIRARTYAADEQERLPHLTAALRRVLEEYPDAETGLSRSERQICEALTPGPATLTKLFRHSHQTSESWAWLGDLSFAWYVDRLSQGASPLLLHTKGTRVLAPTHADDRTGFWERRVELTAFGTDVVRARADAIAANGVDRWIGGVHLTTTRHWRWDGRQRRTILISAN